MSVTVPMFNTEIDQEALDTQTAMRSIEDWYDQAQVQMEPAVAARLDNALLNVAINRILALEGSACTATLLLRLADAIGSELRTDVARPIELNRLDA